MQVRFLLNVVLIALCAGAAVPAAGAGMPVIYCTDLFHPHDDPDDHFDVACLYALPELDLRAVILDQGRKQEEKPGRIPLEQMNQLTGQRVPYVIGLATALESPLDTGDGQPEAYQGGVNTILDILRETSEPVTIIAVGSLRDVAAAYNRAPELFGEKVARLYAFIGESQGVFREYNADLDIHAYQRIMNAPLPVYWAPCFDGGIWVNEGNASFWQAPHRELLAEASAPVLHFFIYAMLHKNAEDPIGALFEAPLPEEQERVLDDLRNLWCCAVFPYMAGRNYVLRDGSCHAVPASAVTAEDVLVEPFSFVAVQVHVDDVGRERYDRDLPLRELHRFRVNPDLPYAEVMTSVSRKLLGELSGRVQR